MIALLAADGCVGTPFYHEEIPLWIFLLQLSNFILQLTFVFYFLVPKKWRWIVLLVASYAFYLLANVKYLIFVLVTTVATFYAALLIERIKRKAKEVLNENEAVWDADERKAYIRAQQSKSRAVLTLALLLILGILGFLKYYGYADLIGQNRAKRGRIEKTH